MGKTHFIPFAALFLTPLSWLVTWADVDDPHVLVTHVCKYDSFILVSSAGWHVGLLIKEVGKREVMLFN